MMFKDKYVHKFYAFALAAVFALTLAGCGGGGGSTQAPAEMPDDSQMACEDAGGRWNDNETCTSAADLAAEKLAMEREDIKMKLADARTAVGKVDNDSTAAEVSAADAAIAAAKAAIADAENVPEAEKTANTGTVTALETQLAAAKTARMTAMDDAQKAKDAEMMATAMKLYAGIGASAGVETIASASDLLAYYNPANATNDVVDGVPANAAANTLIMVRIGDGTNTPTAVPLTEDKDATVADNHGWEGKKYTAEPDNDGTYEAVVYSNVGEPTMGAKFNSGTGDGNVGFALADGALTLTDTLNAAARVASPQFDHDAGYKTFKLPEDDLTGQDIVVITGSYYGVAGKYACTPTVPADGCRVNRASNGYTLALTGTGGGAWTFTPNDPNARVTESPDAIYASYGWWIHKSEDGNTFTASAFADVKGLVPAAADLDELQGTATYMGGAAGKYALHSATGGKNDAGHFTARATLKANFNDDTITGTIDEFKGADGESRDWSVELKEAVVGATGEITRTADNDTVWTIDGTAAAASGEWSGTLYDNGDDGVPKVGTGTFHSTHGPGNSMVGAFGVNKQ